MQASAGVVAVLLVILLAGEDNHGATALVQKGGSFTQSLQEAPAAEASAEGGVEAAYNADKEKFANEHPNQASKIHLKHLAEREGDLREEYKKERMEAIEALAETNRAHNAIVVILVLIVLITILFEKIAHWAMNAVSDFSKPVVEMLFKELTVLGFIALLVFMSVKTGIPEELSIMIFGTPSELIEMFDTTHVLLFFIVVLFVLITSLILKRFQGICEEMDEWEQFAAENEKLGKTHTEMLAMSYGNPPAPLGMRMTTFFNLRNNFLRPTLKNHHVLDANIKFSEYIKDCTSQHFRSLVEVEPWTWGVILVMLAFARLYMIVPYLNIKLSLFLFLGILVLTVTIVARNKALDIYMRLCTPGNGGDGTPYYLWAHRKSLADDDKAILTEKSWLHKQMYGERDPNPHEALFWFGVNGPHFMAHLVQTVIFVCSVYLSLIAINFVGQFSASNFHSVCLLTLSFICPFITLLYYVPQLIQLVIMITAVEMLRNKKILHNLGEKVKNSRRKFVGRLVHTLKSHSKRILRQGGVAIAATPLDTAREREVSGLFSVFEEDCAYRPGVRYIPREKVADFFIQIGMSLEGHELEDMVLELGDGLDGILFEQTVEFLSSGVGAALSDQMIDAVFVDIDKEESDPKKKYDNEISEDELCSKMASVNSYFGSPGGASQLIAWLEWSVNTYNIEVITRGEGNMATRCFTPHTFRKLLRMGAGHH